MLLIIKTNKEKLHDLEFVRPIEEIVSNFGERFVSKHYNELSKKEIEKADKVIITGTSLQDDEFLKALSQFEWLKTFNRPVLGICAGMQIISLIFGAKLKKKTEIGFYFEFFKKEFLGAKGKKEVYHLHNNYATLPKDFEKFTTSKIPQAIKHISKPIYGVLFHPEVRNQEIILEFLMEDSP